MTDFIPTWESVREPAPNRLIVIETEVYLFMEWGKESCPPLFRGFPTLKQGEPEDCPKREFSRGCGFIKAATAEKFALLLSDHLVDCENQRNLHKGHREKLAAKLVCELKQMGDAELTEWVATHLGLVISKRQRQVERVIEIAEDELGTE